MGCAERDVGAAGEQRLLPQQRGPAEEAGGVLNALCCAAGEQRLLLSSADQREKLVAAERAVVDARVQKIIDLKHQVGSCALHAC